MDGERAATAITFSRIPRTTKYYLKEHLRPREEFKAEFVPFEDTTLAFELLTFPQKFPLQVKGSRFLDFSKKKLRK